MSNTRQFTAFDYFKCLTESFDTDNSIGNLTLAQAMDFFWNIETVGVTFNASAQWHEDANPSNILTFSENGVYELSTFSISGGLWNGGGLSYEHFDAVYHDAAINFSPDPYEPYERICLQTGLPVLLSFTASNSNTSFNWTGLWSLTLARDGLNAGMYRIGYVFSLEVLGASSSGHNLFVSSYASDSPGGYGSGTATLNGQSIPYYVNCAAPVGWTIDSASGSLSLSSAKYTYV